MEPVIVVHGGAGTYKLVLDDVATAEEIEEGVTQAARAGYHILTRGGTAVDAVQAAVKIMEDDPIFNAGRGSFLTLSYTIEMDASIMDGATLKCGAVGCITNVSNPIDVARAVMDKTKHVMFVGDQSRQLSQDLGFPNVSTESLITEKARKRFLKNQATLQEEKKDDTVGAVAVDSHGNVAYATTTGGTSSKASGRVGSSLCIGCGGYADNNSGAVTATGEGEAFIKQGFSKHVCLLMEQGSNPQGAMESVLERMTKKTEGTGGAIAVSRTGDIGVTFNTQGMAWVSIKSGNIQYGMYKDELKQKSYTHDT